MICFNEVEIGDIVKYDDDSYYIRYHGIVVDKTVVDQKIHVRWLNHHYCPFDIVQPYDVFNREGWALVK